MKGQGAWAGRTTGINSLPSVIWGYRWWLLAFVIVVTGTAYEVSARQPVQYRASAQVVVTPGAQASGVYVDPAQLQHVTDLYDQLAKTRVVAQFAASGAGAPPGTTAAPVVNVKDLQHHITVLENAFLQDITFVGHGTTPEEATSYANDYANGFVAYVVKSQDDQRASSLSPVEQQIVQVQTQLGADPTVNQNTTRLSLELQTLQAKVTDISAQPIDRVSVIQSAEPPLAPSSPRPKRDALLAIVASLTLGVAAVVVRLSQSDRFSSAEEAAEMLGVPVLAEMPRGRGMEEAGEEAFRVLRTAVRFSMREHVRPVLVVTGTIPDVGKTYVTTNLALAFAAGGSRVIAVDADLRRPSLHERLDLELQPGLGDLVTAGVGSAPVPFLQGVDLPASAADRGGRLDVLTAGHPIGDPAEALSSRRVAGVLQELPSDCDVVVIDTPPLAVVDPVVVSRHADGVLLVIDARRDRRSEVRRSLQSLLTVDVAVIGFVFNSSKAAMTRYRAYPAVGVVQGQAADLEYPAATPAEHARQGAPTA